METLEDRLLLSGGIEGDVLDFVTQGLLSDIQVNVFQGSDPNRAGDEAWDWVTSVATDANGHYAVSGLDARMYRLRVDPGQGAPVRHVEADLYDVAVVDGANTMDMDLQLRQAGTLYGYVYDEANQPLANAHVLVEAEYVLDHDNNWHDAWTDSQGRYEFYLLATSVKIYPVKTLEAVKPGDTYQVYGMVGSPAGQNFYGDLTEQGFTYLGEATGTQSFPGGYNTYIIQTQAGYRTAIDAIEDASHGYRSGGPYWVDWNVENGEAWLGAPDGDTAWTGLRPSERSYVGFYYDSDPGSVTVHVVDRGLNDDATWYAAQIAPDLYACELGSTQGPDFHLVQGGVIRGRVTTDTGLPVPDVDVLEPDTHIANGMFEDPNGRTDAGGYFQIPNVPADTDIYLTTADWGWRGVMVGGLNYAWGNRWVGPFRVSAGQTLTIPTLTTSQAGTVRGVVRDVHGNPIVGVHVNLSGTDQAGGEVDISDDDEVITDALGQYRIDYAPAGELRLQADKEGWLQYYSDETLVLASGQEIVRNIVLQPSSAGAHVTGEIANFGAIAPRNQDGVVLPYSLVDDYESYDRPGEIGVVVMPGGRAWTPEELLNIDDYFTAEADVSDGYGNYFVPGTIPAGQFEMDIPVGQQQALGYRGWVTATGSWETMLSDLQALDGTAGGNIQDVSLTIPKGTASVSGTLSVPQGYAGFLQENAAMICLRPVGSPWSALGRAIANPGPDGRYELAEVPAGTYYLYVVAKGLAPYVSAQFTLADGQGFTRDMALTYGATVGGTIRSGAAPVAGAVVTSQVTGAVAVSDDQGHYLLQGLQGGNDVLRVTKPGFAQTTRELTLVDGQQSQADFDLASNPDADAYEPDDTSDVAFPIAIDGTPQTHTIHVASDVDWVSFTLTQSSDVTIETRPRATDPTGGQYDDTAIWLYGPGNGTDLIAFDDDGGVGQFSRIQRMGSSMLPAGTYYVKVAEASGLHTMDGYTIFIVAQDTTRPQVIPFTPRPDGTVVVDFSKTMLAGNVDNGEDIRVTSQTTGEAIAGVVRWSLRDTRLIWQPVQPPAQNDTWRLWLAGEDPSDFVDTYGNLLVGGSYPKTWSVQSGDVTSPIVNSAAGLTGGSVTVTFNEPMRTTGVGPQSIFVTDSSGAVLAGSVAWDSGKTRLTWTPANAPSARDTWTIALSGQVADALADATGNVLDGNADGDADGDAGDNYTASWVVGPGVPPRATFKGAPDGTVTIDFDQPMLAGDIENQMDIWVVDADDPSRRIPGAFYWSREDTRLTWQPNLASRSAATWRIVLAASGAGDFASTAGVLLDGEGDGQPGGDFIRIWPVEGEASSALRVLAFEAGPDGTAVLDFSGRVLSSVADAEWNTLVTDAAGHHVPGSITWSLEDRRLTWQPDQPPVQDEQWTISIGEASPYDFVDVALNTPDDNGDLTPSGVIRQWTVSANATAGGVIFPDRYESNETVATAATLDVSVGPQSFRGLTIHSASDVDWFSFTTSATGTANDRVFADADVHGGALTLAVCTADGTVLGLGAADSGAPSGAMRQTLSLDGLAAGTYTLRITAQRPNAAYDLTIQPPLSAGQETWTVLYYINGDNNLDEGYYNELDRMEQLNLPSNVNVAVLFDRIPGIAPAWAGAIVDDWSEARRGFLRHEDTRYRLGSWLGENSAQGELDMGSSSALAAFITWATTERPATHYVLNIVDHGDGVNGVSFDQTSGNTFLSPQALDAALATANRHFDVLIMDACLTGMAEVASAVASRATYLVASEEATYTGSMPAQLGLLEASASWNARTLAGAVARDTARLHPQKNQAFGQGFYTSESVLDLQQIEALNRAIKDFAHTVGTAAPVGQPASATQWNHIGQAIAAATQFLNANNRDLGRFMQAIRDDEAIASPIRGAARDVLARLESAVVENYSNGDNAEGLAVTLPFMLTWDYNAFGSAFTTATAWQQFLNDVRMSVAGPNQKLDWAEPNNWEDQAYRLHQAAGIATLPELTIDSPGDRDYFLLALGAGGDAQSFVQVIAVDAFGNPDASWNPKVQVYRTNDAGQFLSADGTGGAAQVSLEDQSAGLYYVCVSSQDGLSSGRYRMTLSAPPAQGSEDWVGDNHTQDHPYAVTLDPGIVTPYIGLVADSQPDWFSLDLTNLTNGPDGSLDFIAGSGGSITVQISDASGNIKAEASGTSPHVAIQPNTLEKLYIRVTGQGDQPETMSVPYTMTVKAPSYRATTNERLVVDIGTGKAPALNFTDADGTKVTVRLTGGTAKVVLTGTNLKVLQKPSGATVTGTAIGAGQDIMIADIQLLTGSTTAMLTVTGYGGNRRIDVQKVSGSAVLSMLQGFSVDLTGEGIVFTGAGAIRTIMIGNLLNGADIIAPGAAPGLVSVTAGQVGAGSDMTFGSPVSMLSVLGWAGAGTLTAPTVGTLMCRGDFGANVNLTAQNNTTGNSLTMLSAANVNGSALTLLGGAGTINVASWVGGSIQAAYLGTVLSRGGFGATVNVTGNRRGTSLQMASITGALTSPTIMLAGAAGTIIAGSWPSGQFTATYAGSIIGRGGVGASLNLTGQNAAGNGLTMLSAGNVNGSVLTLTGGAGTINVASWVSGSIQAAYLGTLMARGGFGAAVNVTGNRRGTSLQMASITGALTSPTITLAGAAGTIIAGSWPSGQFTATYAGSIIGRGGVGASLNLTGQNAAGNSLTLLSATGAVTSPAIALAGAAGTITAGSWSAGQTSALRIGTFMSRGDFTGNLRLTGCNTQGSSLTLLSITKQMLNAEVRSRGGIGTVSAGSVVNSKVYACVLDAVTALPLAGEFQAVPVPGKSAGITSFSITNPAGVFQNSFVSAPSIGTVTLRGVQTNNSGVPFGLAVDTKINSLMRFRPGATPSTKSNITASLATLPAEGDFQVNVI